MPEALPESIKSAMSPGGLNEMFENAPIGIFISTTQGRFLSVNPAMAKMFGYSSSDEMIESVTDIARQIYAHTSDNQEIMHLLRKHGEVTGHEHRVRRNDGTEFWVSENIRSVRDQAGDIVAFQGFIADINERKIAEEVVRQSEYEKTLILDNANEIIAFHDRDRRLIWANKAYLQGIQGVTDTPPAIEDIRGMKCFEAWGLTKVCNDCPVSLAIQSGQPQQGELTPENQKHWPASLGSWMIRAAPVKNVSGEVTGAIEIAHDITERRQMEMALKENEERFRTIAAFTSDWEYWLAPDGRFIHVSPSCKKITGYSAEDFMHDPDLINRIIHPEDKRILTCFHAEKTTPMDGLHKESDLRIVTKSGEIRWLAHNCQPVYSEDGRFMGRRGSNRDITARKKVEDALRKSEERYRTITRTVTDYIFTCTVENGEVVQTAHGPGCIAVTGYSTEEFAADPHLWFNMVHPEDADRVRRYAYRILTRNDFTPLEHRIRRRDGEERWISNTPVPRFDASGTLVSYDGLVQDITKRKQAEEKIKKINQQLEKASAEKDKLFSIIAHDLRSPVSGLLAATKVLSGQREAFTDEETFLLTIELHKNAQNTFALLEDLLQWARMSQGGIDFQPRPCNLDDLLNKGLSTAQDIARSKEISILMDIPRDLTVLIDEPMIKTVIRNVLFNALKFTHRGGQISISARRSEQHVTTAIQDNGKGMSEDMLSSIFTMEKTKRQLGTEGEKGTGLGLILCKRFIEKHEGRIWVESAVGKGTTVFFTLPAEA